MRRRGRWAGALALGTVLAAPALAAPAELDSGFGTDGVARVALHEGNGFTFQLGDVATAADGSSVLLGGVLRSSALGPLTQPEFDLAVAKLTPAGRPDASFGTDGVVRLSLPGFEMPARVGLDGQGRVLFSANRLEQNRIFALVGRLTAAGALDSTFGSDGISTVPGAELAFAGGLAVDDADRPAVAVILGNTSSNADARAAVVRFTTAGALDTAFGSGGTASVVAAGAAAVGLTRTPAGDYVVSGVTAPRGLLAAKLDPAGALIPSFGTGGITRIPVPGGLATSVRVDGDGRVLIGGMVGTRSGVLVRLGAGGRVDDSFGVGGVRSVRAADGAPMPVTAIVAGPAGSIVFVGPQQGFSPRATVGRVLASGAADAGFGGDGYVHPLDGLSLRSAATTAVTAGVDGKLVVAGIAATDDRVDAFAARFRALAAGSPVAAGQAVRVAGHDRIATALELSRRTFVAQSATAGRAAGGAVLAAASRYPDALVGAPFAAAFDAPLLLTGSDTLDPRVRTELARLLPQGGQVTLMGGISAISVQVEFELRGAGYQVTRIAGNDRYETSVRAAEQVGTVAAVLARGDDFADALAAGPAAAELGGAVLLTAGRTMPASVQDYLDSQPDLARYAVGGHAAAAAGSGAEAVVGTDRYDTAARVANRFFSTPGRTVVASGERFPDALAGGAYAALHGSPLLLSPRDVLPVPAAQALQRGRGFHRLVTIAGGTAVLGDGVLASARTAAFGA